MMNSTALIAKNRIFKRAFKSEVRKRARSRGITLLEAILAIGVAASLMGVTANVLGTERNRQKAILLGSEGDAIIKAAKAFVSQNYADLQDELFIASGGGTGRAIKTYSTSDLVSRGYLPPSFNDSGILGHLHGHRYALLMRAVNRSDSTNPQATMRGNQLDPLGAGTINVGLRDLDPSNGEMDIEALLVSYGGTALKPSLGGDIIGRLETSYAGFVNTTGTASGVYGSFTLNLSPYSSQAAYPTAGHFASVIALSNFGVLGADGGGGGVPDPLRRCDGLDTATAAYSSCLANNEIYTDLVLNSSDTDGDGSSDKFPAIRGLSMVQCGNDATENSDPGRFVIDCAETRVGGSFIVEGTDATIGNLEITSDQIDFNGQKVIGLNGTNIELNADKLTIDGYGPGGQNVAEAIYDSRVVQAGATVDKPVCPAGMNQGIYITPAAYSDPYGRNVVGVRVFAEDAPSNKWRIRMMAYIGQDYCGQTGVDGSGTGGQNSITNPIRSTYVPVAGGLGSSPSASHTGAGGTRVYCSTFETRNVTTYNPVTGTYDQVYDTDGNAMRKTYVRDFYGDGNADLYELGGGSGRAIVQTRCYE